MRKPARKAASGFVVFPGAVLRQLQPCFQRAPLLLDLPVEQILLLLQATQFRQARRLLVSLSRGAEERLGVGPHLSGAL